MAELRKVRPAEHTEIGELAAMRSYGKGSIARRGNRFRARACVNGREVSVGTFDSREEAELALADALEARPRVTAPVALPSDDRLSAIEKKLNHALKALRFLLPDDARKAMARARRSGRAVVPIATIPSSKRLSLYEITEPEYRAIWESQSGRCAICHSPFTKEVRPCIDHDHSAELAGEMRVRGLLCKQCNIAEGHYRSSIETHLRGALYLMRASGATTHRHVEGAVMLAMNELAKLGITDEPPRSTGDDNG